MHSRTSPHICLIARPTRVLEHQLAVARQAQEAGVSVCWLDLGSEPGVAETVMEMTGERALVVPTADAFRRHLKEHRPLGVWLLTPFPDHYPDWLLAAADGRLVYSGYGPNQSTWTHGLYQLDTYAHCGSILADSAVSRRGYIDNGAEPDRVFLVGTPLMYDVRRHEMSDRADLGRDVDVLWAPHWTEDWFGATGYSSWRRNSHVFLQFASRHPEYRVLVRPHPLLEPTLRDAGPRDSDAAAYRALIGLPNVELSDGSMVDDIARARALVTDGVSIIAYFAATGRPMGITRYAESPDSNEIGHALVAASDLIASEAALADWLEHLPAHRASDERRGLSMSLHPTFERSPVALWLDGCRARPHRWRWLRGPTGSGLPRHQK